MRLKLFILLVFINLYGSNNPFKPSKVYLQEKYGMTSEQMDEYEYYQKERKKQQAIHMEDYDEPVLLRTRHRRPANTNEANSENSNTTPANPQYNVTTTNSNANIQVSPISTQARQSSLLGKKSKVKKYTKVKKKLKRRKYKRKPIETICKHKKVNSIVDITIKDDVLYIKSDYNIFKKFNLNKSKKIVIDFIKEDKKDFLTKFFKFDSDVFKLLTIGNHSKEGYFRIVIKTALAPSKYKATYKNKTVKLRLR
jgi:hypothetical protein